MERQVVILKYDPATVNETIVEQIPEALAQIAELEKSQMSPAEAIRTLIGRDLTRS